MIADVGVDQTAMELAEIALQLRGAVLNEFPDAMSFVRPGFDEPNR